MQVLTSIPAHAAVCLLRSALLPDMHAHNLPKHGPPSSLSPPPPPTWLPHNLLTLPPTLQPLLIHACTTAPPHHKAVLLDLSIFPSIPAAPLLAPLLAGRTALSLRPTPPATALPSPPPTPACARNRAALLRGVCCAPSLMALECAQLGGDAVAELATALPYAAHLRHLILLDVHMDDRVVLVDGAAPLSAPLAPDGPPPQPRPRPAPVHRSAPTPVDRQLDTHEQSPAYTHSDDLLGEACGGLRGLAAFEHPAAGNRARTAVNEGVGAWEDEEVEPGRVWTECAVGPDARVARAAVGAGRSLAGAIVGVTRLATLELRGCRIGAAAAARLAGGLPRLAALRSLRLLHAEMPAGAVEAVLCAAGTLPRLTGLEFAAPAALAAELCHPGAAARFAVAVTCMPHLEVPPPAPSTRPEPYHLLSSSALRLSLCHVLDVLECADAGSTRVAATLI